MLMITLVVGSLTTLMLILLVSGIIYWMRSDSSDRVASNANASGESSRPSGPAKQQGKEVRLSEVLGIQEFPTLDLWPAISRKRQAIALR